MNQEESLRQIMEMNEQLRRNMRSMCAVVMGDSALTGDYPFEYRDALMEALRMGKGPSKRAAHIRTNIRHNLQEVHYEASEWHGLRVMRNVEHPEAPALWFETRYPNKEPVFVGIQEGDSNLWDVPDVFNHLYMQLVLGPRAERSAGARARALARGRRSPSKD